MVAPVIVENAVPLNPNRIGGSASTYPDQPTPLAKRNITAQPATNRAGQFIPPPVAPAPPPEEL
jgi:hypothetical protein